MGEGCLGGQSPPGGTVMPSGMPLRVLPLAADRRMSIQPGVLLQASLRQNSRLNGRMAVFETKERSTISELSQLTGVNINTIKKHLASLVKNNHLIKHGTTRGVWYTKVRV